MRTPPCGHLPLSLATGVAVTLLLGACGGSTATSHGDAGSSSGTSSGSSSHSGGTGATGTSTKTGTGTETSSTTATHTSTGVTAGTSGPTSTSGKVDILFDVDNSASMGDKQAFLINAIPEMIARLVTPRCLDAATQAATGTNADPATGGCPTGSSPEFAPVHDMHVGVVTSSLGSRLGTETTGSTPLYVCNPTSTVMSAGGATVSAYNDDQGHLINRTGEFGVGPGLAEATLPEGGGFLSWFPSLGNTGSSPVTPPQAITAIGTSGTSDTLVGDFSELVDGAGESGCGIESQLESWYRFLVQPDPYATLVNNNGVAEWSGVDTTILQQRHDFLRPDSIVAVVVLTAENDSEIDVRSFQGTGYSFMSNTYSPTRATAACFTDPSSADCKSCAALTASQAAADPSCSMNGGTYSAASDIHDWGYDLNLRHSHMQQKYALDAQFPLTRYSNGLTSKMVPNRVGEYPTPTSSYTGTNNCTNPLFAASLPEATDVPDASKVTPAEVSTTLCNLPAGSARAPSDVFFLHVGGVPHQLLQSTPGDGTCPSGTAQADCPQKASLAASDWVKILGTGPAAVAASQGTMPPSYDYSGIDPHMIESETPRNVVSLTNPMVNSNPAETTLSGPGFGTGADPVRPDPINGREWTTTQGVQYLDVDVEYACIFQLPLASQRDCAAIPNNTIEENSCGCPPAYNDSTGAAEATGNTPDEIGPLCSMTSTDGTSIVSAVNDYTVQTYAKAYPTIRELTLAAMLGGQGVVSSMCPIHTADNTAGNDPLYGYRPAVDALVDRMKGALPKTL